MSNNFYAHLQIGENVTWKLHIGLTVGGKFATLCGRTFPTVAAWRTFLAFNKDKLTILDDSNVKFDAMEIAEKLTDFNPVQLEWQRKNGTEPISPYPVPENWRETNYWLDEGVLFSNGVFS